MIDEAFVGKLEGPVIAQENQRAISSQMNVVLDELSSTVLVLNLPCQGDGLLGRTLAAHAALGEPCRLQNSFTRVTSTPRSK
ncbi:MAG: hypothetical protein WD049_04440 [Candidatus Paceibacterota bacterium]